jgi:hypothetical protein
MRFTCRLLAALCCLALGLSSLVRAETVLQSNPYSVAGSPFPQTLNYWCFVEHWHGTCTYIAA